MRLIGCAQRALELMCARAQSRVAFGKPLGEQGSVREDIAHSWCEIEQARLLTLRAAEKMDREGNKAARDMIAAAKVVVPSMAARVIDRAIQIHGGAGVSQDTFLAEAYMYARFMRLGDGPDQVHLAQLGRGLLKRYARRRDCGHRRLTTTAVIARLDRATQYAAAYRFYHCRLWNTGSPGRAGERRPRVLIATTSYCF